MSLKRWKHGGKPLLIPDQHEPGVQRGYLMGSKGLKKNPNSEHSSKSSGQVVFWKVGTWARGSIFKEYK
mgnify:CR=1 FL=1